MRVAGKWNGSSYRIERGLGEGANGKVYLVRRDDSYYAMKVGSDAVDLQVEVNVLQALSRLGGSFRNFLVDVDDWSEGGQQFPFYIMKYVKGSQLQVYLADKGRDWFPLVGLRLLERLSELHARGYVFGDLKRENVMVSGYGQVELVDFGGVTPKGRAVKQFTELYDRAYWNAGDRSADEQYDLFAFAVLCIQVCGIPKKLFSKGILPQNRSIQELMEEIRKDPQLREYEAFLVKALRGGYKSSGEASEEWRRILQQRKGQKLSYPGSAPPTGLVTAGFVVSVLLFAGTLWYYW
jgi:serine/threonine protein kinase